MTARGAEFSVVVAKDLMVPMRDGVRLATDVYRPAREGEAVPGWFPTILQRTIYDKNLDVFVRDAEYFCRRGYVSVVQDCRGRHASEGGYYEFLNEGPDGVDTLGWIGRQPWSDSQVGTIGFSYGAQVQSALAVLNPPHLRAMIPVQGPSNAYTSGIREGGAFQLRVLAWAFWEGATSRDAAASPVVRAALEGASIGQWLLRLPIWPRRSPLALVPDYERWLLDFYTRGDYDDFWRQPGLNFVAHYGQHADVPTYYVTGWYDSWLPAVFESFSEPSKIKAGPIKILVGPWTHGELALARSWAGEVDFGPAAPLNGNIAQDYNAWRLRWFDRWLKGLETGVESAAPVRLFVMGGGSGRRNPEGRLDHGGRWRDEREWPLARTRWTPLYFHAGGVLSPIPPGAGESPSTYRYDPDRPVPTIGGNLSGLFEIVPLAESMLGEVPYCYTGQGDRHPRAGSPGRAGGALRVPTALPTVGQPARHPGLYRPALDRRRRGDGSGQGAALGFLNAARHRLYGEALGCLSPQRGLPRRILHESDRGNPAGAVPRRVGAGDRVGAGPRLRAGDRPLPYQQPDPNGTRMWDALK